MREYTSKRRQVTFALDGAEFTVPGGILLLDLVDLAELGNADEVSAEAIAAVGSFFRQALGAEYERFHVHCREHGTDNGTLLEIITDLVADSGGFPTQLPSPSAGGPASTGTTYKVFSSSDTVVDFPLTPQRKAELQEAVAKAHQAWAATG